MPGGGLPDRPLRYNSTRQELILLVVGNCRRRVLATEYILDNFCTLHGYSPEVIFSYHCLQFYPCILIKNHSFMWHITLEVDQRSLSLDVQYSRK